MKITEEFDIEKLAKIYTKNKSQRKEKPQNHEDYLIHALEGSKLLNKENQDLITQIINLDDRPKIKSLKNR